mmetsp:Transcript_30876/g.41817  ORF Transcript_30876/g.41817 Transcript_30876/m.41817 type:complete len:83 (-) Transcript_30876:1718-1966(-)
MSAMSSGICSFVSLPFVLRFMSLFRVPTQSLDTAISIVAYTLSLNLFGESGSGFEVPRFNHKNMNSQYEQGLSMTFDYEGIP